MKKNFLKEGWSFKVLFALVALVCCALAFTSCQKENKNEGEIITRTQGEGGNDTTIVIGSHTHHTGRTWTGGNGHSHDSYLMKDTSYNVPFAGVYFWVDPNDTLIGTIPVTHVVFNAQPVVISEPIDTLGWHATRKTIAFADGYGQYSKIGGVFWFDNIWRIIWGDTVKFPDANVSIDYYMHNSANVGSDNEWIYTLVTSTYKLTAIMGEKFETGLKTIKTEKASVQGFTVIDSSLVVIAFDANGNPTKAKSTVDAIRDGEPLHIETTLNSSAIAAADTTVEASDFNLSWAPINVGGVVNLGNVPDANDPNITKTNWTRSVSVGATGLFIRGNRYNWQTASWTDGTYSVNLPSRAFTGFIESHTLDAMSPVTGFNRKLATNTVTASFDTHTGTLNDHTTVKVAADDPGPGPGPDDPVTIVDSTLINPQLLYQDPTHGISKVTKRYTYSDGHTVDVDIVSYPENGYECLSSGVFYGPLTITGIDWGTPTFVSSRTSGNIRYDRYEVTGMISYGVGIHKDFRAWVERPVYIPMGYAMLYGEYSFAVSALNFLQSLGQTTTQNTTYNKGLYEQGFTGTLYAHTNQYGCDIEVWEQDYIPRESPTCFGAVQNMTFSMVSPGAQQNMVECKVIEFEHGWAIVCQGQTNFYAKAGDNACSGYQTMPVTNSQGQTINYQSGIKVNGTWYPATVTPSSNSWLSWTWGTRVNGQLYTLTMTRDEFTINHGGGNGLYKPIPDAQAFSMSGPVGVLQHSHLNLTDNMNTTFMFW